MAAAVGWISSESIATNGETTGSSGGTSGERITSEIGPRDLSDVGMPNESNIIGWVLTGVVAIVGTLATVVATLWKQNEAKNSIRIEQLEMDVKECREDRDAIRGKSEALAGELFDMRLRIVQLELKIGEQA